MKVLLTGANGFLGRKLLEKLCDQHEVVAVMRRPSASQAPHREVVAEIDASNDWSADLSNCQVIIHAAARAHVSKETFPESMADYRKVNVEGTLNLAQQAAEAGIRRFIFISSIGVNGNANTRPFTPADAPAPIGPYAQSKWEAEQLLQRLSDQTGMEVVIIRPPLVYGPSAPGNFGALARIVDRGLPLPFGLVKNKRSLVGLDNLVDLIFTCIEHPAAANEVFLVSDGEDLSTSSLVQKLAAAMERPPRLFPVPVSVLMLGARLLGKQALALRLIGSLQVDITKTQQLLGWEPPVSVDEGLRRCFMIDRDR